MTMLDERHKIDTLFVLVGKNTLPNYVAARLLLRNPAESRLVLVHSQDTVSQRQRLEDTLKDEGFRQFEQVEVEESNPIDIENKLEAQIGKIQGKVGLNYTGGTKAMSVHAYRVLDRKLRDVQFSYLDARRLRLVFAHEKVSHPVGTAVPVSLNVLLGLHSRTLSFKPDPLWPQTARAIADLHTDDDARKAWHRWIAQTFFSEPQWPQFHLAPPEERDAAWQQWVREQCVWQTYKQRNWDEGAKNSKRLEIPIAFQDVRNVFIAEANWGDDPMFGDVISQTQTRRVNADPNKPLSQRKAFKKVEDLGTWFEGEWLESYVLDQVQQLQQQGDHGITDIGRDLQAHGSQQVQIDVAFTRGYQLFALACTSSDDRGLCKHKLLEVVVRAEQLGGAEARCALICCHSEPKELEKEVADLSGANVRVFGRDDLRDSLTKLGDWIRDVSGQ